MLDRLCHTTVGKLTSLSAINVETRNHAESQNQRLVKTAAAQTTAQRPPETPKIVLATSGSVRLVPLRNVHVQEKLTCLHVITENLHPYNPIWGQCKALHHVVGYDPHFTAPQLLAQNLALPEVAGVALPATD